MSWLYDLVFGTSVASSIILVAFTITVGIILGKVKIFGISLGITWILFVGIVLGHFGLEINPLISSFVKDFGLILFVYSIGLQLGPGFFSSLKQGGLRLNLLAVAAVGLSAGENFFSSIASGGYIWIVYGLIITIVPLLLVGLFARMKMKMDYFTLCGLLAGSTTDPPALAFANEQSPNDAPSVAYASVYPLTMFLRVLSAQVLMIIALS